MGPAISDAVYNTARVVAARLRTAESAAHLVPRQITTMSVVLTYSYMSVGQSLVANLYEAGAAGQEAAARVARRVITYGSMTARTMAGDNGRPHLGLQAPAAGLCFLAIFCW